MVLAEASLVQDLLIGAAAGTAVAKFLVWHRERSAGELRSPRVRQIELVWLAFGVMVALGYYVLRELL